MWVLLYLRMAERECFLPKLLPLGLLVEQVLGSPTIGKSTRVTLLGSRPSSPSSPEGSFCFRSQLWLLVVHFLTSSEA